MIDYKEKWNELKDKLDKEEISVITIDEPMITGSSIKLRSIFVRRNSHWVVSKYIIFVPSYHVNDSDNMLLSTDTPTMMAISHEHLCELLQRALQVQSKMEDDALYSITIK